MSYIKKFLFLAFLFLPGIALADSEQGKVDPVQAAKVEIAKVDPIKVDPIKIETPAIEPVKTPPEIEKMLAGAVEPKKETPPASPPPPVVHKVQTGDTLTAIGESHQTSWSRVYDANSEVQDPNLIFAGQKLRIPRSDETITPRSLPSAPPVPAPPVASAPPAAPEPPKHQTRVDGVYAVAARPELVGTYGQVLSGGNCVNTAKAHGKNQPGNPISWVPTTQTPFIGAAALFNFNHVAVVVGIHSNGELEVVHENCPGCPTRYSRSIFRGFF